MASKQEEIFNCVLAGDLKNLQQHLENENGGEEAKEGVKFEFTDEMGRNALFAACSLGRSAIVRELVKHGARLNKCYSPLHCATCWGHLETVKTLLELGANPQAKNFRGERPVDVAKRYSHTDCADCLDLAEAKQDFLSYISYVTDTIFDRENTQGIQVKFNKEEKNKCMNACSTMSDWIQNVKNPTLSDYTAQRKHMEDTLQPILSKLSAQSAQAPAK